MTETFKRWGNLIETTITDNDGKVVSRKMHDMRTANPSLRGQCLTLGKVSTI